MSETDIAVDLFRDGCACSQAILGTYGPRAGLGRDLGLRVAAGFGAGMRMAETCGAVTGAFMALGLAHSDDACKTVEGRKAAYAAVESFAGRFKARNGSLVCRELLGCDISTPEGHKTAVEKGLFQTRCADLVRDAAHLLEELLPEP
jgi:C_GCAxxG_C_C family probable redox protein